MISIGGLLFVSGAMFDLYVVSGPEIKWKNDELNIITDYWFKDIKLEEKYSAQVHDIGTMAQANNYSMLVTDGKTFIGFSTKAGIYQVYDDINDTKYFPEGYDAVYTKVTKILLDQTKELEK